jgi:lysozyme
MNHLSISKIEAGRLLSREVRHVERQVAYLVTAKLTSNQFSALVSLVYNIGSGNFQASTLRRLINRNEYEKAADEFPKWRRAGGRILPGLVRRRGVERALFLTV